MLIVPKWLKLQTSNSASMLPRKSWHDHWKKFGRGTWQGSHDNDNSNVQTAAMGPMPHSTERILVKIQFESRPMPHSTERILVKIQFESRPVLISKHHDALLFMVLYREALDRLCVRLNMYLVYLDDILIFSKSFEQHCDRLVAVFVYVTTGNRFVCPDFPFCSGSDEFTTYSLEFLWVGVSNDSGVVDDGNFWRFTWLLLWKLYR